MIGVGFVLAALWALAICGPSASASDREDARVACADDAHAMPPALGVLLFLALLLGIVLKQRRAAEDDE